MPLEPKDVSSELKIPLNSNSEVHFYFTDESDAFENLTGFTQAVVTFYDFVGGTKLFERTTSSAAPLVIGQDSDSNWFVTLPSIESADWSNLPVGTYIADLTLEDASGDWIWTEVFYVKVVPTLSGSL